METGPALRPQSRSPYLAVECTVSTLQGAGPAPPLSHDSHNKLRTSTSPSGIEGLLPCLDMPGVLGRRGGSQPKKQRECRTRIVPRGGPWTQRVSHGASDHSKVEQGSGNPRVSQLVPEEGARSQRALLGRGRRGVRATSASTHALPRGPKAKKRRRSHAVTFPFLPEQSHAPTWGMQKKSSRKLRQRAR